MLDRVRAVEFIRSTTSGRNRPAILLCERSDGRNIEVVAKFSGSCDQGVVNLAREAFSACLASNLNLPIPEPVLIKMLPDWAQSVVDPDQKQMISNSSSIAFGSMFVGNQFNAWNSGSRLRETALQVATAVFVFDAIIQNHDRRPENPNCLVRGDEIRIFDHDLAFAHRLPIIGVAWLPPWQAGGLKPLERIHSHIFRQMLGKSIVNLQPIRDSWMALSDERIAAYVSAMPIEWGAAAADIQEAADLIKGARDNIDDCLAEIQRVLK